MYEEFSQLVLQREEGVSQQKLKIKTTVPLEKKKGGVMGWGGQQVI